MTQDEINTYCTPLAASGAAHHDNVVTGGTGAGATAGSATAVK